MANESIPRSLILAGRKAAEAMAAASAGFNPKNARARSDMAVAFVEIAEFLERNSAALAALARRDAGNVRGALADEAARVCAESILSVDQFAELDGSVIVDLRDLYATFVDRLLALSSAEGSVAALPDLIDEHRRRMAMILGRVEGLLPPPAVPRREPTVCAEYSPALQSEILALDEMPIAGPALDIGCGRHARLLRALRSRGIAAFGIERFELSDEAKADGLESSTIVARDWKEYAFRPESWTTVLSHLAFSNHFVLHARRASGRDILYAGKYREILDSLSTGGTFRYAPSLPFVERHVDRSRFEVIARRIGPEDFPFTATIVRRLRK